MDLQFMAARVTIVYNSSMISREGLSVTREEAFEFLDRTARGIAEMFGSSCETLVHDMGDPTHPIVHLQRTDLRAGCGLHDGYPGYGSGPG